MEDGGLQGEGGQSSMKKRREMGEKPMWSYEIELA